MSTTADKASGPPGPEKLTKKDFTTDQEVRWCPGCGDYAILSAVQSVFPTLGIPREKFVIVSGIGCSSRFPYYMNTYGFHTIHGRAPAFATGIKLANPELSVWVVTGDGDGLSIGGNHLIHALRRNIDIKILLFNNRIYGLTKGQASPTSEKGKKTRSTPLGTVDYPFNPIALALASGATFVARAVDVFPQHQKSVIEAAARHRGAAFVEIYQNCNIFNDGAFIGITDKKVRSDAALTLEEGRPLVFGRNSEKGIRMHNGRPEVVSLGDGVAESDLMVHRSDEEIPTQAGLLSYLPFPEFPVPIGIFRRMHSPTFEEGVHRQIEEYRESRAGAELAEVLSRGETWKV
jgi:2-oxoglutarate ferredoxin oxidoreductase subunit beta